MKFRNYCIIAMGTMDGVKDDILKVAETKPRYLDATGILIATFASVADPAELEEFFKRDGRSFFIFDLDAGNSAFHLDNLKLYTHLFGYQKDQEAKLREISSRILDDISASTSNTIGFNKIKPLATPKEKKVKVCEEMSPKDREIMINNILDKGYSNMSDSDKRLIKKLSKLR
jgi:hypothetical protein